MPISTSVAPGVGQSVVALVCASVAWPFAGGRYSPDMDQYKWWRTMDAMVPDELLFFGGPLRHRGITHWWGIPFVLSVLLALAWQRTPQGVHVLLCIPVLVLVEWWSHLVTDCIVGARYRGGKRPDARPFRESEYGRTANGKPVYGAKTLLDADDEPRGPGIPLFPWWGHVGLGYRNGSTAEYVVFTASVVALIAAVGVPVLLNP